MAGVPFLDGGAAVVHGRAATGVAWLLQRAVERGETASLPDAVRAETLAAIQAVDLASRAWARRQTTAVSTADCGSSAARPAPDPAHSNDDLLTTAEAAEMLGVKERRARDLAASGLGRRVGGSWVLDRAAVEAEAERRGAA